MRYYFIYVLLLIAYFLACLLRGASGVILPEVAEYITMSPSIIGVISGMFFYGYTIAQPYCGDLCDRKSPLLTVSVGLIILSIGLFIFAVANSPFLLGVARFLTGLGSGPTFCALLAYQANAFPPKTFAKLMGMTIMFGHFGGVIGITPIGTLMDIFGYKKIHLFLSLFAIFIAFLLAVMMKSYSKNKTYVEEKKSMLQGFKIIYGSKRLSSLLLVWSMGMILQLTLIGLWGVTWLTKSHVDISIPYARICMTAGGIGVLLGAFTAGMIGNKLILISKIMQKLCFLLVMLLLVLTISINYSFVWQFISLVSLLLGSILGTINVTSNIYLYKIVGTDLIGTVTGANNVVLFLSVLLSQWFSGLFIDYYEKFPLYNNITAYTAFFSFVIIVGVIITFYMGKIDFIENKTYN